MICFRTLLLDMMTFGCYSSYQTIQRLDDAYHRRTFINDAVLYNRNILTRPK